jgi:hypothetical protein
MLALLLVGHLLTLPLRGHRVSGLATNTQVGEGNYGRTEGAIRALLAEAVDPAADREAS